jgi:hypothetical protein
MFDSVTRAQLTATSAFHRRMQCHPPNVQGACDHTRIREVKGCFQVGVWLRRARRARARHMANCALLCLARELSTVRVCV